MVSEIEVPLKPQPPRGDQMFSPVAVHAAKLRECLEYVQRNRFDDEDIQGDALSDEEFERLDTALFFFRERWCDDPILVQSAEHGAPETERVQFVFVDFLTHDAIRPFQSLARYSFASRRLYLARNRVVNVQFLSCESTIDGDTRHLLARARITMRIRTMQYVVKGARRSRLLLAPTNVVMGYVV